MRHPRIVEMMAPYIAAKGNTRIALADILTAANKRLVDLPMLPIGEGGEMRPVCWAWALGKCTFYYCKFKQRGGHVAREKMTDEFAESVVTMLQPGVTECVRRYNAKEQGGGDRSPAKKVKWDEQRA